MNVVVQERLDRLNDILDIRRQQLLFRLIVAGTIIVFYSGSLGVETTLAWATVYGVLQIIERSAFTPFHPHPAVKSVVGYWFAIGLIVVNPLVFCSLGVLWPFMTGPWGVSNGALLLAGAMINAVLTTKSSRPAFLATIIPTASFVLILPLVAWRVGANGDTMTGIAVGGLMLIFTSLKLWQSAHMAHNAELAARAEAEQRRAEAESAVAAKSAFVAVVSHELRTPISAILAGAAELERTLQGAAARGNARLISDAGSMMRTLLNDLLDLAKLDAGRMSVETIPYDLREVIADQLRFWRAEARKKGVRLRLTGAAATPRFIASDPTRLRQIINNLLSNALKFTTEGSVTVGLRCEMTEEGKLALQIDIEDTGLGMSEEQMGRLFKPFDQADASIARTHGGTGLGLVISRELARMMGGDIVVSSTAGEGSCFSVTLVAEQADGVAAPEAAFVGDQAAEGLALKILVVDDHEINRRAIGLMLEPLSAEISTAATGGEALLLMSQQVFDVVLMDVHMPDMSGHDVARVLRAQSGLNQNTPVIAVTGGVSDDDVAACLAAGMNDWVAKPIDAGKLYNALGRQLNADAEGEDEGVEAANDEVCAA